MIQSTSSNTIIQTSVDSDKMGRVMSLYAMGFFGGAPIGALLEGELAKVVGPVHMFAIAGAGCLLSGLVFARALRGSTVPPGAGVPQPA
jgi:hypothetical protein